MNNAFFTDFPVWLPSALVKELRQGLRTSSFTLMASVLPAAMALFFLFGFIPEPGTGGKPIVSQESITTVFWSFMVITLIICIPFRALSSVREELASRNSELLLLTRQTSGRIILGKWTSFMAQALLMVFIALPFALIRYYYGQVDLVQDVTFVVYLYLACGVLTALYLWISALPALLRVMFIAGLFFTGSSLLSLIFAMKGIHIMPFHDGFWPGLVRVAVILTDCALVVSTMLILARRWFAPAAENTAEPLRKILLGFYAVTLAILYAMGDSSSPVRETMVTHTVVLIFYSIFLMVVELATPTMLLPVHVERLRRKKLFHISKFIFLPGMPGSVFFTMLMAALWGISQDAANLIVPQPSPIFLTCLAVAAWYALTMPAMFLKPFWHRLKINSLLAYLLVWGFIAFLLTMMTAGDLFLTLIPGSDFIHLIETMDEASSREAFNILFCLMNLAAGFIVLNVTNREWFQTLKTDETDNAADRADAPGPEQP